MNMGISKFVLCSVLLIVVASGLAESFEFHGEELASEASAWKLYERWVKHHSISRNRFEKHARFNVFKENANHVFTVNQMNKPYKLRLNKFADMTNHEFVNFYARSNITHYRKLNARRTEDHRGGFMYEQATNLPSSIDWRKRGAVTPVKSQSTCQSCWAFAAVGAVEGINQIKTKKLLSLSEQELVDCDPWSAGCRGGYMNTAFEFIAENGGIATENNYPYYAQDGYCRSSAEASPLVTINGYERVPEGEEALMKAVANQPVTVGIDAQGRDFQFYWQGVFDGYCGTWLDHGVVAVGYGTEDGTDYWIVKNSWGTGWGERGYIRMKRGVEQPGGLCGIASDASYPVKF